MVPMRDGVKLHTLVDMLEANETNKTVVIVRSPYGPDATERIADVYLAVGAVAVRQDIRGSHGSEGNFSLWRTEYLDVYDTLAWISEQSWSNGRVYTVGASADGMATFSPMLLPPPALKGQFFIFSTASGYPIIYPGGAFREALAYFWMSKTFPAMAPELIATIKDNEAPGSWWFPLNATGHFSNVTWPSTHYAGWHDIFLVGHLAAFEGMYHDAAPADRGNSRIVVDPLGHCQSASKYYTRNLIAGRVILAFLQSFEMVLEKPIRSENASDVTFYVMGSTESDSYGQYWVSQKEFPKPQMTPYYLHADRSLSTSVPSESSSSTTYIYDPANPVPTIGGSNLELTCGPLDQSSLESRPDVITFSTPALTAPLPLTGPVNVVLYVESNATDTDFTAKLTDVYPTGESRILNDGIVRMRWRNVANSDKPEPMLPGTVYEVTISVWNVSYIFSPGHRVRVAISSSNYERFSPNPNNGLPLNVNGTVLIAENTFHHSSKYASYLELPVVTLEQLPEFKPILDIDAAAQDEGVKRAMEILSENDGAAFNKLLFGGDSSVDADVDVADV